MDHNYLGYVEFIHEENWGRIRPLAIVKKRSADDNWVVDHSCKPDDLGNTGRVFWPKIPHDQNHLVRQYVRFKVELNQRTRDPDRDDEYIVAEEWRNGNMRRVWTLGLPTLAENRVVGLDRVVDQDSGLRPDSIVYRRLKWDTQIDGPWRVVSLDNPLRLCLQPKEDDYVVEHELGRLGSETYHVWEDRGETQVVLLVEPAKTSGKVIDLLPASGLAKWLIRVLNRDKSLLTSLDRASPGWRGRVGELLVTATDQVQRLLERGRFAHLEAALDALAYDEARLDDLAELPRFKELLDVAIGRQVAVRREKIEADARAESSRVVVEASQTRDQAKAAAERDKQALRQEIEQVRTEVADTERLREEARAKIAADESSIRAAADYLVESRERIIRDFSVFQGLIEHARASGNIPVNGHNPAIAKLLEVTSPTRTGIAPEGPSIEDAGVFFRDRLAPIMAAWGAAASRLQAKRLHVALLTCRWVATPCPSWGVAYAEAMGANARHQIVAVEPAWLTFSDAWEGEVEAFWREAVDRRDALHLLILADADRALVQCWARPLLDIVSGLRLVLPSGLHWPENLRVMSCPSADKAALPVPDWVVSHWAGINAAVGATRPDGPIAAGHVPFTTWHGWAITPDNSPRLSPGLGVAVRSAARERSALARTIQRLDPDDDPNYAEEIAREIREVDARTVFAREVRG